MGEAVKDHKGGNKGAAQHCRQLCQGGDEDACQQYGEDNTGFNPWHGYPTPGNGGAQQHSADDKQWGAPFHGGVLAHAPEADGGHGQQVVQAEHGVEQAAGEAFVAVAGVGHGGGGREGQGGGCQEFAGQCHGDSPWCLLG